MKKIYLLICVLALASCGEEVQKPTSSVSLQAVSFNELPNFDNDNLDELKIGFSEVCNRIMKMRTPYIADSEIKIATSDYQRACQNYQTQDFKQYIKDNFNAYLVKEDDYAFGKFTSYFEPTINVSKEKTDIYKYPIYAYPQDMVEFNIKDFAPEADSKKIVARKEGKHLTPYFNREYIENVGIKADVLFYTDNPVDLHIMHIQGPAVGILPDGSLQRIAYAGNNGKDFKGLGRILLENKLIKHASMNNVKAWLEKHPDQATELMQQNNRFIFHRLVDARGPIGAMGLPLTAGRSLAVDSQYIPLGSLMWIDTVAPNRDKIQKMVIAQDIGSAIKGVVRGDYFWGTGADVLEHAGSMNASGRYFILLPKEN